MFYYLVVIGVVIYFTIMFKSRLVYDIFGRGNIEKIFNKLKRRMRKWNFDILTEDEFRNFSKSCPYESFMQTVELAHLKEELGSKIHYVGVKKDDNIIASSLMLEDTTILGKKMFYAPSWIY